MTRSLFVEYTQSIQPIIADALADMYEQELNSREGYQIDILKNSASCYDAIFNPKQLCKRFLGEYLYRPLADFSQNPGKLMRPSLCILACELLGGTLHDTLQVSLALEVFQNAALIHDDIADNALTRRGKPCLHVQNGIGLALNCGDLNLINVLGDGRFFKNCSSQTLPLVKNELFEMITRTIEGQALDLGWTRAGTWNMTEEEYLAMATLKTAHYSCATPLVLGALCSQATTNQLPRSETVETLRSFGILTGLAFQIQDDLLNLQIPSEDAPKDVLSDITEGKRTLCVIKALKHLPQSQKDRLIDILGAHTTKQADLLEAYDLLCTSGAIDECKAFAQHLCTEALLLLDSLDIDSPHTVILQSMTHYCIERTY